MVVVAEDELVRHNVFVSLQWLFLMVAYCEVYNIQNGWSLSQGEVLLRFFFLTLPYYLFLSLFSPCERYTILGLNNVNYALIQKKIIRMNSLGNYIKLIASMVER